MCVQTHGNINVCVQNGNINECVQTLANINEYTNTC